MTIGWRTPGAWASGSTSVTPALPASPAAGDRMILFVGCKPFGATIADVSGWTRIGVQQTNGAVANATDAGSVAWSVFYRDWQSGDAAPAVTVTTGNVALACIHGATKTAGAWAATTAYFGSDTSSDTGYSITAASSSGNITNGDGLIHATVIAGNNATFSTPTLTAASATIGVVTESPATEGTTATGLDLEASSASALCTAGTSTADAVAGWTLSAAQTGGSALVRLREDFTQTLTQSSSFSNSNGLAYTHTLTPGAVALSQTARFDNSPTFYTHVISQGGANQELTQSATATNSPAFYAHTLTPGEVALTQSATATNSPTFYSHTLTPGEVALTQSARFDNSNGLAYAHTLTPGAVALSQSARFDNSPTFYTHAISQGGADQNLTQSATATNSPAFYAHTLTPGEVALTQSATATSSPTFYSHTLTPGEVALTQSARFDDADTFYSHTLTPGEIALVQSARFDNNPIFYTHALALAGGAQALTQAATYGNSNGFYAHSIIVPLVATPGYGIATARRFDVGRLRRTMSIAASRTFLIRSTPP